MVLFEESSPPVPAETDLIPDPTLYFFESISSIQDMYYISNTVNFLTCNSILPPLEKDTSTQFACITLKVDSTEDFRCFDDCLFSSEVPYITKSFYTKEHMDIHSPVFNDINLLQKDLLPIIFFTNGSLPISPYKMNFVGSMTPLPDPIIFGGMGHGAPITGIVIVQCILHSDTLLSQSTITTTTSQKVAIIYLSLNYCLILMEETLEPSTLVTSVLQSP